MTDKTQRLIDAVEAGESTDPGGMTTTRDVADVVPYEYSVVEMELEALEREGAIESTTFGNDRVWIVPEDPASSRVELTTDETMFTTTRVATEI